MRLDAIVYRAFTSRGGARAKASRAQGGVRALVLGAILLATPACATSSYMGISMIPGEASPEVQGLAQRARAGNKQAQFDLGIKFEEGNGVPQDEARAIRLYKQAARDSGGAQWVYVPSPGNGAPARVMPVDTGPRQAGLEEAKRRLGNLLGQTPEKEASVKNGVDQVTCMSGDHYSSASFKELLLCLSQHQSNWTGRLKVKHTETSIILW